MKAAAVFPRALAPPRHLLAGVLTLAPLALSAVGVGVSAYLTYSHYGGTPLYCEGVHGCDTVAASEYSVLVGIPVAVLGMLLYVGIIACALGGLVWPVTLGDASALGVFGLGLMGFVYSGYLTWVEIFRIEALCLWCVISACLLTIVFILSVAHLLLRARWQDDEEEA
jgi:uncharacterized membrane protein